MALNPAAYSIQLRRELGARNRLWARGRAHVESYGSPPVIVYAPEETRHGNFYHPAYRAIAAHPPWLRRFDKIHAQGRALPKAESGRRWRELDSSMSSDALLMNIFCAPGVVDSPAVRACLGLPAPALPEFGWKARVPLANGRFDRTEVDLRLGPLLLEAKLTESGFQTRAAAIVEGYRDFEAVFHRDLLPRTELRTARLRAPAESPEDYSQEFESLVDQEAATHLPAPAQALPMQLAPMPAAGIPAYLGYQLIRNVLAAHAEDCSFCVLHDERRPDLREAWFQILSAVRSASLRTRLAVLTWQELAALLPAPLQEFLDLKYGIVPPGRVASNPNAPSS
jgi:hypothetical protein